MNGPLLLGVTAATVGLIHTLLGPDHYVPFIVLGKARGWSFRRTLGVTLLCGGAHVGSSIALGFLGIALGVAVQHLTHVETLRGSLASWGLIIVGTVYGAWGLHRALRGERHVHDDAQPLLHAHPHDHHHDHHHHEHEHHEHHRAAEDAGAVLAQARDHALAHAGVPASARQEWKSLTPWVLFVVFVLGPCEPLIPLVMVPAAAGSVHGVIVVSVLFTVATLLAMTAAVSVGRLGLDLLPLGKLERYTHALAGAAILVSGLGIKLLGW